jgi:6-phosphogluconolactonase (cycloisomerase 2 family)
MLVVDGSPPIFFISFRIGSSRFGMMPNGRTSPSRSVTADGDGVRMDIQSKKAYNPRCGGMIMELINRFSGLLLIFSVSSSIAFGHDLKICKATRDTDEATGSFGFHISGLSSSFPHQLSIGVGECQTFVAVGPDPFSITEDHARGTVLADITVTGASSSTVDLDARKVTLAVAESSTAVVTFTNVDLQREFVYVAGASSVSAFRINANGSLSAISSTPSDEVAPNAIAVSDRFVLESAGGTPAAGGSIATFRINGNGSLTAVGKITVDYSPESIAIDPTGKIALEPNQQKCGPAGGGCQVNSYRIENDGTLTLVGTATAGLLPARPAFHPSGSFAYVPNHADVGVSAFRINPDGSLTNIGGGETGFDPISAAVEPSGRFLYVTNFCPGDIRTCDSVLGSVSSLKIASDGTLTPIGLTTITDPALTLTGSGPIVADRSGRFVYMINGCTSSTPGTACAPPSSNSVIQLSINPDGFLTSIGPVFTTVSGVRADSIVVDASGLFAYILTSDSKILSFRINPDGSFTAISSIATSNPVLGPYSLATNQVPRR